MRRLLLLAGVFSACGPNPTAPVPVMVVAPSSTGAYAARKVDLTTISSLVTFKGLVGEFIGGGRIIVDVNDPLQNLNGGLQNQTPEQRYDVIVKNKGLDVRGNFFQRDGVFWPADFHTWAMASTYFNLERSYAYFQAAVGDQVLELQNAKVFYWPEVRLNASEPLTDNALYLSLVNAFVVVPHENDQLIPLGLNLGVIGHETAHRVFNKRVLANQGVHPALGWNLQPFNLLKSLDEGLADFHGYGVTCVETTGGCRPAFLAPSISNDTVVRARDLSRTDACMTATLRTALTSFEPGRWISGPELYAVGTLFASALYQTGNKAGQMAALQRGLLSAYDDTTTTGPGLSQLINQNINNPAAFTPEAVVDVIAAHLPAGTDLRRLWCNEATDRLQIACPSFPCAALPSCPANSARGTSCPVLPAP